MKFTCLNCAYWQKEGSQTDQLISGDCHFWQPTKNQEAHRIIPVQFENPRLNELRSRLEDAEESLDELRRMNEEAFKSGKSFDQIKKIQKEMEPMAQKVSDIQMELTNESPYAIEEILVQYQRGSWPVTASDDWCGQWMKKDKNIIEDGEVPNS